jgi:hypothetical protein
VVKVVNTRPAKFLVVLAVTLVIVVGVSCRSEPETSTRPNIELRDIAVEQRGGLQATGSIYNASQIPVRFVRLEMRAKTSSGQVVGKKTGFFGPIPPGGTRRFWIIDPLELTLVDADVHVVGVEAGSPSKQTPTTRRRE